MNIDKTEIQELGLTAVKEFFKVDPAKFDKNFLKVLHEKAKIGMQFEKEMGIGKRAVESTYLRIFNMITTDPKEKAEYIKQAMPNYSPMK